MTRRKLFDLTEKIVHSRDDPDLIQTLFYEELKYREHQLGILGNKLIQILEKEAQEQNEKESKK